MRWILLAVMALGVAACERETKQPEYPAAFGCNGPQWCFGVTPDGWVFAGDSFNSTDPFRKRDIRIWSDGKRQLTLWCAGHGEDQDRAFICYGLDSEGRTYAGATREPDTEFFRQR